MTPHQWENNAFGMVHELDKLNSLTGNLRNSFMPYRIMIDGKSRIHLVYVNRGVPKGNRDFFKEDLVFGGYADLFQESNLRILTQEFETVLNFFEMFTAAHLADGVYWYSGFIVTPKEFIRLGGNTNTKGSYGAYPEEIIGIYGEDKYLIESVR